LALDEVASESVAVDGTEEEEAAEPEADEEVLAFLAAGPPPAPLLLLVQTRRDVVGEDLLFLVEDDETLKSLVNSLGSIFRIYGIIESIATFPMSPEKKSSSVMEGEMDFKGRRRRMSRENLAVCSSVSSQVSAM